MLKRWTAYIKNGGTKKHKIQKLNEKVYNFFIESRRRFQRVSPTDIRREAIVAAKSLNLKFRASMAWLKSFKKKYRLTKRKATKIVQRKFLKDQQLIQSSISNFRNEVKQLVANYSENLILNCDETGVNVELFRYDTLETIGSNQVFLTVNSKVNINHSHTLMPIISLAGETFGKLFIIFQEKAGEFGPIVARQIRSKLEQCTNVEAVCTESGKLTLKVMKHWIQKVLCSEIQKYKSKDGSNVKYEKCLLLLDSYGAHWNESIWDETLTSAYNIRRLKIPPGTTAECQPLDVYFNYFIKQFSKNIWDYERLYSENWNLHLKCNIILLYSLMWNQFSAPRFRNFLRTAWKKSGILDEEDIEFINPVKFCFTFLDSFCCHGHEVNSTETACDKIAMITCAYCNSKLCMNHFFVKFHFHVL